MAERGKYFAVCCVDESSTKIVDKLLSATYSTRYVIPMLVVIDSLDTKYVEPSLPPVGSFSSPFSGKSAGECCKLIRDMTQQTKSDLNYEYIVVLDKRSFEDSTALLVLSGNEGNEIQSVRTDFDSAYSIAAMSIGFGSISERQELAAKEPDGVFRIPDLPPQPKISTEGKSAPRKQLKRRE